MSKELNPKGLQIRKEMFGEEFVAKRMANATDFSRPFVEIINDFAYGEIWTRPGLDRKARSMLTLGMLIALDKPQEIKLHVKVAIKNGVSGSRSSSPGFPRAITLLSSLAYPFRCGGNLEIDYPGNAAFLISSQNTTLGHSSSSVQARSSAIGRNAHYCLFVGPCFSLPGQNPAARQLL